VADNPGPANTPGHKLKFYHALWGAPSLAPPRAPE
jgi:hypothetical protein